MINPETRAIYFCDNCPGQKDFVGELAARDVHVEIGVANGGYISTLGDGYAPGDDYVSIRLGFQDEEGGQSDKALTSVKFETLRDAGIDVGTTALGAVKSADLIAEAVETRVLPFAETFEERVSRCVHASVSEKGNTSCPALANKVLRGLVDAEFKPVESRTAS